MTQKILRTLVLSVAVLFVGSAVSAAGMLQAGQAAPAFDLPKASGGTMSLDSFRGKPLYVNFFATWCGPCNEEAPSIVSLYDKYHAKGLEIVGIDDAENAHKALGFAADHKFAFPILLDRNGSVASAYGAIGLPVHTFIDKHGNISTYRIGEMSPSEIEDAIKKIL
jgi:peroxiredoxin